MVEPRIDGQELRVAVVMNGGVSLAVWMGGVTRELDRLRRCDGAYAAIARLTRSLPRVDVIAGSSAGGINGAVLAVAIARGSDVTPIRDIWVNAGSIGDLLRDPMQRDAPSLFYGDQKLLTALSSALRDVAGEGDADAVGDAPLHLTVTGTMLEGEVTAYADHFGAVIRTSTIARASSSGAGDRVTRTLLDPRRLRRRLDEERGTSPESLCAEITRSPRRPRPSRARPWTMRAAHG